MGDGIRLVLRAHGDAMELEHRRAVDLYQLVPGQYAIDGDNYGAQVSRVREVSKGGGDVLSGVILWEASSGLDSKGDWGRNGSRRGGEEEKVGQSKRWRSCVDGCLLDAGVYPV